ncbi:hypothetical protein [Paraburkholderia sp. Cpub6]|uniref:hypothetical protein n=1 Tax=Paraburkholderia sp. Cpub6 TaxID=2723094 RepID=UPI0016161033|nr:hypothetical protein [Paraburkholderia sp. Cpub6]MBB5461111.1 hypothetical protein [Paraburkholderia sp. Cpub6]
MEQLRCSRRVLGDLAASSAVVALATDPVVKDCAKAKAKAKAKLWDHIGVSCAASVTEMADFEWVSSPPQSGKTTHGPRYRD